MHLLLEIMWEDLRLSYDQDSTQVSMITGEKRHLREIWVPRVFFTNKMESQTLSSFSNDNFMVLLPSGLVVITTRIKTHMSCELHLAKFPFDQQICEIKLHSWSYNSTQLNFTWEKDYPIIFKELKSNFAEFDLLSMENNYSLDESADEDQHFNSLIMRMRLVRRYGYYFLNYYLPSVLIVMISWVTFWLQPSAVPGRVTIGSSTMLTFIQLCWSEGRQKVSQFMANDVWAVTCTAFIFLSLAEFAFVNTIDRKGASNKVVLKKLSSKYILRGGVETAAGRATLRRSSSCPSSPEIRRHFARNQNRSETILNIKEVSISLGNLSQGKGSRNKLVKSARRGSTNMFSMSPPDIAIWIDDKSKIVFPIAFLVFNVIYWLPLIFVK